MKNCLNIGRLYITPEITNVQFKEQDFLDWTDEIEYKDQSVYLPDGTIIDAQMWINNQLQFDNGSYTKYLTNYYYDNVV